MLKLLLACVNIFHTKISRYTLSITIYSINYTKEPNKRMKRKAEPETLEVGAECEEVRAQ